MHGLLGLCHVQGPVRADDAGEPRRVQPAVEHSAAHVAVAAALAVLQKKKKKRAKVTSRALDVTFFFGLAGTDIYVLVASITQANLDEER